MLTQPTEIELAALVHVNRNRFPRVTAYHDMPGIAGGIRYGSSFIAPVLVNPDDKSSELLGFLIGRAPLNIEDSLVPIRRER